MAPTRPPEPFSEKGFYLREFRGRTLALCAPADGPIEPGPLEDVLRELAANGARALVLVPDDTGLLAPLGLGDSLPADAERLEGDVWRGLQKAHAVGIQVPSGSGFASACRAVASRLGVSKLVFLDPAGGLARPDGSAISFVDLGELAALLATPDPPRAGLLRQVRALLESGVAAVNVCTPEGLADELFTYAGSGTLFTRERYLAVRRLTLDDYDAAHDLMTRGVEEGYLAPREPRELERILAGGLGAFVEDRFLAGIGALLVHPAEPDGPAGEISALYTLTRFQGEGVGTHLVRHAVERARSLGLARVFACTTRTRVGDFFARMGFDGVDATSLPPSRWEGYDPERRARLLCYELRLDAEPK